MIQVAAHPVSSDQICDALRLLGASDELKRSRDDVRRLSGKHSEDRGNSKRKRSHKIALDVRDKRRIIGAKDKIVTKAIASLGKTEGRLIERSKEAPTNTLLDRRKGVSQIGRPARTDTVRKISYSE